MTGNKAKRDAKGKGAAEDSDPMDIDSPNGDKKRKTEEISSHLPDLTKNPLERPVELVWPQLEDGIKDIFKSEDGTISPLRWMELYCLINKHCITYHIDPKEVEKADVIGGKLYLKLKDFLTEYVSDIKKHGEKLGDEPFLNYYGEYLRSYLRSVTRIDKLFDFLNRHFVENVKEIDNRDDVFLVKHMAIMVWHDVFFNNVKDSVFRAVLAVITKERSGQTVNRGLLKSVIASFVTLCLKEVPMDDDDAKDDELPKMEVITAMDLYKQFEEIFLAETETYFRNVADTLLKEGVLYYMLKVDEIIRNEVERAQCYLHESTHPLLLPNLNTILISSNVERIVSVVPELIDTNQLEDLGRVFTLLSKVDKLAPVRTMFENHMVKVGSDAIKACAQVAIGDPKVYVEEFLRLFDLFTVYLAGPFQNDTGFSGAFDKAFRKLLNDNEVCTLAKSSSKSPDLLARYVDGLLKKNEPEAERKLTNLMTLFKFIEEKDVFLTIYSASLARRLISGTSSSEDLEALAISKLKETCGSEFVVKLQRMFTDMATSKDLTDKFRQKLGEVKAKSDFSAMVLAQGSWPLKTCPTPITLPSVMQHYLDSFGKFYSEDHGGRKLAWIHHLSKGELKVNFPSKAYLLQCSTFQMAILLQLAHAPKVSYDELKASTQMNQTALDQTIRTLLKTQVLISSSPVTKPGDLTGAMSFSLNPEFKSPKPKVNINIRPDDGPEKDKKAVKAPMADVEEDRKIQLQCAIVRIMKAKKTIEHRNLVTEIISEVSKLFSPKIPMIKRCIDLLIEKEFMKRSADQPDSYDYMA